MARGAAPLEHGDLIYSKFTGEIMRRPVAQAPVGAARPCLYDMLESASTQGGFEATVERTNRPLYSAYLLAGVQPFAEFVWLEDVTPTPAVADAIRSVASKITSVCRGDANYAAMHSRVSRSSVWARWTGGDTSSEARKVLPEEERTRRAQCRTPLFDNTRHAMRVVVCHRTGSGGEQHARYAAVTDSLARVLLLDVSAPSLPISLMCEQLCVASRPAHRTRVERLP